ncbi:MAG: uroporphyrinogen-III synthase [Oscillochloridaceae bacterium umkhey_bin13]
MALVDQPLLGWRVLVPRPVGRGEGLAEQLRALGAEPILHPLIAYAPPEDQAALAAALARLEAGVYEWLLLTSVAAVEAVEAGLGGRALGGRVSLRIGAVGPATAAACQELLGATTVAMPERFLGAELAGVMGDPAGRRVLLPLADLAGTELEERLQTAGALVERVTAYRTVPAPGGAELAAELAAGQVQAILLSSGSTVRSLVTQLGPQGRDVLRQVALICIGPATATVCHDLGLEPAAIAEPYNEAGLIAALVTHAQ